MSIYRNIALSFWTDSKVDEFSTEEKLVFLYILTNPLTTISGCYEMGMHRVSRDLGYPIDTVSEAFSNLEEKHGVIRYDADTREVLIVNWGRYNWTSSPKIDKPIIESIQAVKSVKLRSMLVEIFNNSRSIPYPYPIDTVSDANGYPIDTVSDTYEKGIDRLPIPPSVTDSCIAVTDTCSSSSSKSKGIKENTCNKVASCKGLDSFIAHALAEYNDKTGQDVRSLPDAAVEGLSEAYSNGRTEADVDAVVAECCKWERRYITPKAVFGDKFEVWLNKGVPLPEGKQPDWPPSLPCPECGSECRHIGGGYYTCESCGDFGTTWKAGEESCGRSETCAAA